MLVEGVEDFYLKDMALWSRIAEYNFEGIGGVDLFCNKLAAANAWRVTYAEEIVREYRKFLYLCCISEFRLSPSDAIDQAWHLHLLHSQEYWEEFCPKVLQHSLHHVPNVNGTADSQMQRADYQSLLELYQNEFRTVPDSRIWRDFEIFLDSTVQMARINLTDFWYFPRPRVWLHRIVILSIAMIFFIVCLSGYMPLVIFGFFFFFGLFVITTARLKAGVADGHFHGMELNTRHSSPSGCSGGCGGGCSGD